MNNPYHVQTKENYRTIKKRNFIPSKEDNTISDSSIIRTDDEVDSKDQFELFVNQLSLLIIY
jgi:hypothetical protein